MKEVSALKKRWVGEFHVKHIDKDGNLLSEEVVKNALMDEGEYTMLDVFFRNGTAPSSFYMGLYDGAPADETKILTDHGNTEESGTGYSRQQIERSAVGWPTLALDSGDYQVTSKEVTFSASGTWQTNTHLYIATTTDNTGKFISYAALSQSRQLNNGESLKITYKVKLS